MEDFVITVPKISRYGSELQSVFDALHLWKGPSSLKRVEDTLRRQLEFGESGDRDESSVTVTGVPFWTLITRFERSAYSRTSWPVSYSKAVWPSDIFSMADCYDSPLFPLPPIAALYIAAFHSEKISQKGRVFAYCDPPMIVDAKEHRWDWGACKRDGCPRHPTSLVLGLSLAVKLFRADARTMLSSRDVLLFSPDPQNFTG